MKRAVLVIAFIGLVSNIFAQSKYIDRAGSASFFSASLVEDIEAKNNQVVSIIDIESGELVASMLMKSFNFRKALMQEHFNENYIESDKFPKATFKGRITNLSEFDVTKDGKYSWDISGDITIHGETKSISVKVNALVDKGTIKAEALFPLVVKDFGIEIPRLARNNIAEEVEVTLSFRYLPMQDKK
ncbi:MAG: YceI family protein [Cyclobacteriaceae bacterium]